LKKTGGGEDAKAKGKSSVAMSALATMHAQIDKECCDQQRMHAAEQR
jgi:hypothetical protein